MHVGKQCSSPLSPRSHPRHLVGKRTAQKDTIIDITSDSQVNSNFPYRWSPANLPYNNYFYLFLYITRITINNSTPHLQSPKSQQKSRLGTASNEITVCVCVGGGLQEARFGTYANRNTQFVCHGTRRLIRVYSVFLQEFLRKIESMETSTRNP